MAEVVSLHTGEGGAKSAFCHTPTAGAILSTLKTCLTLRKMGCIVGGPGVGKSTTIAEFSRDNRDVTVCRMVKAAGRLQPGLVRIVTAIGGYAATQMGSADLYAEILRRWGGPYMSSTLLVIDEAQHMEDELLEAVRDLFDEGRGGIALVGSTELTERWESKSAAKRRKWAQLTSRLTVRFDIPASLPEDIAALCDHHDIVGKRSRDMLARAAAGDGGLRNVAIRIDIARKMAGNTAIGPNHLEEAERVLGLRA